MKLDMQQIIAGVNARLKQSSAVKVTAAGLAKQAAEEFVSSFPFKLVPVKLLGAAGVNHKGYQALVFQVRKGKHRVIHEFLVQEMKFTSSGNLAKQDFYTWHKWITEGDMGGEGRSTSIKAEVYVQYLADYDFLFVSLSG